MSIPVKSLLLGGVVALVLCATAFAQSLPAVSDGDVIFQTSRSSQSVAIQRATHSPYSHMGIVFVRNGKPYVFEAAATVSNPNVPNTGRRDSGESHAHHAMSMTQTTVTITAASVLSRWSTRMPQLWAGTLICQCCGT